MCDITRNGTQSKECHTSEDVTVEQLYYFRGVCDSSRSHWSWWRSTFPLGFSYIDENVPKKDSAAYIGTVPSYCSNNNECAPDCFLDHRRDTVILENKQSTCNHLKKLNSFTFLSKILRII